jgi:surface antigen Omp85-like protein
VTSLRLPAFALLATTLVAAAVGPALAHGTPVRATAAVAVRDTLSFRPAGSAHTPAADSVVYTPALQFFDSTGHEPLVTSPPVRLDFETETQLLRAPIGDHLLDHPDAWDIAHHRNGENLDAVVDYNRVDQLRFGVHYQAQRPRTMYPRLGARLEYATGRDRSLYGVQLEQPLLPTARFVFGFSMVRRTDHPELQQVDDVENSLAMLLARTDYRDYFEREGGGVYLSWRVPDFSTVSVHARRDQFHSLGVNDGIRSWFNLDRPLRPNPAIDDGETHSVLVRLERMAQRSSSTRAGLYHWIELERAGGELGGDFSYLRVLGDVRSVVRLSPASSLSLRVVGGTCTDGTLPGQKRFGVGGVDGLRARPLNSFQGSQLALAQAEYTLGLWALRGEGFEAGLHAIVFVDTGTAWDNPGNRWDVEHQRFATDGGFGVATSEDDLRLYVARDLSDPDSKLTWSLRLQRPF